MNKINLIVIGLITPFISSCSQNFISGKNIVSVKHPGWSYNASIYEVNIRQYTKEGTFNTFKKHLLRWGLFGFNL